MIIFKKKKRRKKRKRNDEIPRDPARSREIPENFGRIKDQAQKRKKPPKGTTLHRAKREREK